MINSDTLELIKRIITPNLGTSELPSEECNFSACRFHPELFAFSRTKSSPVSVQHYQLLFVADRSDGRGLLRSNPIEDNVRRKEDGERALITFSLTSIKAFKS